MKKIKVRIETKEISDNFTHGKEYEVQHEWPNGYTVLDNQGTARYVPNEYVDGEDDED